MKMMDLVELMKQNDSKLLVGIPDQMVVRVIRAVFAQIGKQIDAVTEEPVKVPGFGVFRTRQIEREKDGKKTTVHRTIFRRMDASAGTKNRVKK